MEQIEQALAVINEGKIEEGVNLLRNIEERTTDHQTKYELAEVYYQLGHLEQAKAIVDELLVLYPDEGDLYIFAAEMMIDVDEEDEAIDLLLEIKESDPSFLQAQLLLADLYQLQSLDEVAEQKLLLAEKHAPDEVIISFALGEFYSARGDFNKSIPFFKKALFQKEQLPDTQIELKIAEAYSATGQFEDAMHYYQQGLEDTLNPDALLGYGITAYQLGDMPIAIEQLEALRALDPSFTSLYPYLAKAYEGENRLEESMEVLKQGMTQDEFNEQLTLLAGKLSFKRQQPADGEHWLRQTLALNPSNLEALQSLAAYLKHEEAFEELLELVAHVKSYNEEDSLLLWYEAVAYKEMDEYETAALRYKEAAPYFESDQDFLEEYAQFLVELGDRSLAVHYYQQLLLLNPARHDIQERIDELKEA